MSTAAVQFERGDSTVTPELWAALRRRSTHVALVTRALPVTPADLVVPVKSTLSLREQVAPISRWIQSAKWVTEWPGTRVFGGPQALWLQLRRNPELDGLLGRSGPWEAPGDLEDLQLWAGDRLLLYVCTHEGFGELWSKLEDAPRIGTGAAALSGNHVKPAVLAFLTGADQV